jgi:hypothetical protein
MAHQPNPNDPYRTTSDDEELRRTASDEFRQAASIDSELQPDPELAEGRASGGRIALFAVAIAVVLGAVFYGLNNTSVNSNGSSTAQTTPANPPANQSTAQTATPPLAPGVRDVTPHNNTGSGVTTGAAPAQPQPPAAGPNRPGNAPASK